MGKKISNLDESTTIEDTSYLVAVIENETKKISYASFLESIDNDLNITATKNLAEANANAISSMSENINANTANIATNSDNIAINTRNIAIHTSEIELIRAAVEANSTAIATKANSSDVYTKTEANNLLGNKVDKVAGKQLSTNDFTDQYKMQVETNQTDIANLQTTSEDLNTRVVALERKTGKVYGIKRKITDNSSTAWTRIEDAVGLIANARIATSGEIVNNFNEIYPWSEIKTCNVDSNGNITNYIDEPGFAFDGCNGEVMTRIPTFWFKREKLYDDDENLWEYIYIADYQKEGFIKVNEFLIARYNLSVDSNNKAHSISGVAPKYSTTRANFRTYARNLSTYYCLMDWRAFILQMLYLVEYADYNSQNKLGQGIVAYTTATAIATENSVNRIIVSSVGEGLYVGKTVGIGTVAGNFSVAQDRQITAIEDFSNGEITGKAISFDGTAVNIETGNIIFGSAQICGDCDSLGMESGCLINNGYHSMIYRGVENIFGNIWQHVDGINIKDYQAYVCYDPTQYANDVFDSPYEQLGYLNSDTNDSYIKELGYDENNPAIALPVAVGASSSTYVSDYYWCSAGNRIAYLGGNFSNNWAKDGLFALNCNNASSYSNWNYGARLLILKIIKIYTSFSLPLGKNKSQLD